MELIELKNRLDILLNKTGQVQGEFLYIQEEYVRNICQRDKLKTDIEIFNKAVALLTVVQKATRDTIKEKFEGLVSWALRYVFNQDYKFVLDFDTRGNLQTLDFLVKPPNCEEPLDLLEGQGMGISNVVSLLLRIILMELSKIEGFLILDETFSNVNGEENINRLNNFVEEISERFKRQVIHITNFKCFTENENYNRIELKGDN